MEDDKQKKYFDHDAHVRQKSSWTARSIQRTLAFLSAIQPGQRSDNLD